MSPGLLARKEPSTTRFRLVLALLAAFVGGIAFVVACGDGVQEILDAGNRADAAGCDACEAPITADRIYRKHMRLDGGHRKYTTSYALCDEGDILLGGGCYAYQNFTEWDGMGSNLPGYRNSNGSPQFLQGAPMRGIAIDPALGHQVVTEIVHGYICDYLNDVDGNSEPDNVDLIVEAVAICFRVQAK